MINNVLITGGAGFIGSHLCEFLLGKGYNVICIDNFNSFYDPEIKIRNLSGIIDHERFSLYKIDIRDKKELIKVFDSHKPKIIIHMAAMPGVRPSLENPSLYSDVNINGTQCVLEAMRISGTSNMIFSSSSSVYGNNSKIPFSESDIADDQISPYAYTKRAGELMCRMYNNLYGFNISCLRFFTVFGPRQRPDLAINKFADKIIQKEQVEIFGSGNTYRDYTFIYDIINGIYLSMIHLKGFNIYNLGEENPVDLNEMINTLEEAIGIKAIKKYLPYQQGDVDRTLADISKARSELGYNPSFSFREGIDQFICWKRKQRNSISESNPGKNISKNTLPAFQAWC